MSDADTKPLVIGRIRGVYGVKGWLKIHSYTEPMDNLLQYEKCQIKRRHGWEAVVIDAGKRHGKGLVAHIEGVDDRAQAEALKDCEIAIPLNVLPELAGEDYYWHQLEGLSVFSGDELLGRVDHMVDTGANDVLVVKPCEGSRDQRERLIPWLREAVIRRVDIASGSIEVDWDPEF
ncbi:MAG: ribosome maturation factor RimM [Gammaproteobacteria bacterium]|nr:ribosome maturation factor RimM [Gammaproteobacteria bacterium]